MKKTTIFLLALLLGVGMLAPNIWATSYDPTGFPGNWPARPATANINNHGMTGDALLGEMYRAVAPVDDDFFGNSNVATYVSIENRSSRWVAAHVRLRTGRFSIEAIDFPILLSPYDVFWFQFDTVKVGSTTIVQIVSTDTDTIEDSGLPNINFPYGQVTYVNGVLRIILSNTLLTLYDLPDEYQTMDNLTMGYVEVFGLFSLAMPKSALGSATFYNVMAGLWGDSTGLELALGGPKYASYVAANNTRYAALDVGKFLSGHVFVGDFTNGLYMGYTMKALKDWRAGVGNAAGIVDSVLFPISQRDLFIRGILNGGGVLVNPATILYNYMADAAYNDPDWATTFGPTWNDGDNWYGDPCLGAAGCYNHTTPSLVQSAAVRSFSLDEVEDAFFKNTVESTYFNTGFSGNTFTLAALTFPTKFLHFFFNKDSGLGNTGIGTDNAWPVAGGALATSARATVKPVTVISDIGARTGIVDQRQNGTLALSPTINLLLPWEVNFLPIGSGSSFALAGFGFLVDTTFGPLDVDPIDFPAGIFALGDFGLSGGILGLDPRWLKDPAFSTPISAGIYLYLGAGFPNPFPVNLAVSCQMLDFEFTNYPHARMYDPVWDNPYENLTEQGRGGMDPFGSVGYGG